MATTKNTRGNGLNTAQRMTVRVALATGATIVTLMGAQILALQDLSANTTANDTASVAQQPVSNVINTSNNGDVEAIPTQQKAVVAQPTTGNQVQATITPVPTTQPQPRTRSSRRG